MIVQPHVLLAALLAIPVVAIPAAGARAQALDLSKGGAIDVTAQDGMEWRQNEQVVIARGDARAVRGGVTVTADTLVAHYRKKAGAVATPVSAPASAPAAAPGSKAAPGAGPNGLDTGANEIYRLEAEGNVHIFTATDLAVADHAVYDIDAAVLLLTGKAMTITTPQQVMTARDTMEYWTQKHMAVGRGLATVTTTDGRRVTADVLVGYTQPPPDQGQAGAPKPATPAAQPPTTGKPPADPLGASGKLQRVEGFGDVTIRTSAETVRGDRGVYVADTGIARLAGHVHITRGQNQLDGDAALVNLKTGISTLVRDPGQRVQGLVIPNDATGKPGAPKPGSPKPGSSTPGVPASGGDPSTPALRR